MASGDGNNYPSLSEYINDLKTSIALWEDMAMKSQKLNSSVKITGQNLNSVIESLVSLSKINENSQYSGVNHIGNLLTDVSIKEKFLADKVMMLNNAVQNNLVINLSFHIENWKRSINNLKKEREFDRKRAKIDLKKANSEFLKLESKRNKRSSNNKNSISDKFNLQFDYANQNLLNKRRFIEEMERCSLRKAVNEERNRFKQFLDCLRPVLDAQLAMKTELEELQIIYDKLYSSNIDDLTTLPPDIESIVRQYQVLESSRVNSVASLYSRANSQLSLSGSHCSSLEIPYNLPNYCPILNSSNNPLEFYNEEKKVDTSSSTIVDLNVTSQYSLTGNNSDEETSSSDDKLETKTPPSVINEESLYPNQAIPHPRYSNLRELKQIADKKYGTNCIIRDRVEPMYGDCTLIKRSSLLVNSDIQSLSSCHDSSQYSQSLYNTDNGGYASIYDSFMDVTNNTSTFKRRKPSLVTAMETPTINNDKNNFQNSMKSEDLIKNQRSCSMDRNRSEISHVCNCVEKTYLGPRSHQTRTGRMGNTCNSMYITDMTTTPQSVGFRTIPTYATTNNQFPLQIPDTNSNVKNSINNDIQFKQQLLKVIQGDRALQRKSATVISSQMF